MVIGQEDPVAVVVLDNCGVPANVRRRVAARVSELDGIKPGRLVVAVTHTHNAPNLVGYARILWAGRTTPDMDRATADYTTFAIEKMVGPFQPVEHWAFRGRLSRESAG